MSLASTYMFEKNIDKALAVYQDAEKKIKNKVPVQIQMAAIFEKKKDFPAAIKVYKEILSVNPGNKLAANNYASLLLDYGVESDTPKALKLVMSFEKLKEPALQDTLAWAYARTGDNAKAIKILKPIVEKLPKVAVFRYHLGYALNEIGDKAAAKSHLEIAIASKQEFPGKDNASEILKSI
jgi:tetratricopeptide (TPR) repeat protein